ncbi:Mechanosensitive channel MscK [Fundidesulfovibrio magnetotacticus]|uniref:Mechanosensitive channel MscK n=1 Tax=Fundidesulfovibrio magnetotacticus TaxID=2730080 RepID=A0A6V8M256_9BACT|nr:mechanosensitive ion channel domain-containing protein [Fundidesulfovibrio magnetotacticus]GFK96016.1 Mechanosensitive channel MscK [Fundidesulfovibrio magnetotacticus]
MRPVLPYALALILALAASQAFAQPGTRAWAEVLEGIDRDLDRRAGEIDAVRLELPSLLSQAGQDLATLDNRLTQTVILEGVVGDTPWTYRALLSQFKSVLMAVEEDSRGLRLAKEHLNKIKDENATLREARRKGRKDGESDAALSALEEPGRRMESIKSDADALKEQVDRALERFESVRERAESARDALREDYIRVFKEHFFESVRPPLDAYGLILLANAAEEWRDDYPRFVRPVRAGGRWDALAWATLPLWTLFLGAGWLVARWARVAGEARVLLGWPLMALGLALAVTTRIVPFTANHGVYLGVTTLVACGAAALTRHRLEKGLLAFWLAVFCAGAVLQALALPGEVVGPAWFVVSGLGAWARWRRGAHFAAWCLGALALAALGGMGPLAVVAAQAWFMARLAQASALSVKALLDEQPGSWVHFVTPLAMTLTALACLAWILLFMGGPGFVDHVFALEVELGKARLSLDAAASMVLLFFGVRLALAWFSAFLERASFGGKAMDQALSHTLGILASYVCWTAYLLACLHVLGLPLSGLTWIASGLSVGVGFGLKDIINNFVSGLIILFGGSIKKGDIVQTGKLLGEVTAVSVRNTTVRTMDNSMVIIPNSSFLKGEIINWSYQDKRIRLTIPVSVAPGTKIKKVRKILVAEAAQHEKALKEPAPSVFLRQFGRMGLDFELYVWIEDFRDKFRVESDLATAIDQALQENKITVAFQGVKVKYKPRGSEEAQREAAREALREKRRQVFSLVRPLRRVHMRARWGVSAPPRQGGEES